MSNEKMPLSVFSPYIKVTQLFESNQHVLIPGQVIQKVLPIREPDIQRPTIIYLGKSIVDKGLVRTLGEGWLMTLGSVGLNPSDKCTHTNKTYTHILFATDTNYL